VQPVAASSPLCFAHHGGDDLGDLVHEGANLDNARLERLEPRIVGAIVGDVDLVGRKATVL
jgi:hypothetical protein